MREKRGEKGERENKGGGKRIMNRGIGSGRGKRENKEERKRENGGWGGTKGSAPVSI